MYRGNNIGGSNWKYNLQKHNRHTHKHLEVSLFADDESAFMAQFKELYPEWESALILLINNK